MSEQRDEDCSKPANLAPAERWLRFQRRLSIYVLITLIVLVVALAARAGLVRAAAFIFAWYGSVRLLARVGEPYVSLDGSWFGLGSPLVFVLLEKGKLTRRIAVRAGLGFLVWAVLPWAITALLFTVSHWLAPASAFALYVLWLLVPPPREW